MTDKQYDLIKGVISAFTLKMTGMPSISAMASCANTSKQTLLRNFKSKDELIRAIREYSVIQDEKMERELNGAEGKSFEERVRLLCSYVDEKPERIIHLILMEEIRHEFYDTFFPEYTMRKEPAYRLISALLFSCGYSHDGIEVLITLFLEGVGEIGKLGEDVWRRAEEATTLAEEDHPQDRFYKAISSLAFKRNMTTKAISEAAGIKPSTLYSHYKDKQDLIDTVTTDEVKRFFVMREELREREMDERTYLLSCYLLTARFIRSGGVLSFNLLQFGIGKSSNAKGISIFSPEELYTTLAAVYCSDLEDCQVIDILAKGLKEE